MPLEIVPTAEDPKPSDVEVEKEHTAFVPVLNLESGALSSRLLLSSRCPPDLDSGSSCDAKRLCKALKQFVKTQIFRGGPPGRENAKLAILIKPGQDHEVLEKGVEKLREVPGCEVRSCQSNGDVLPRGTLLEARWHLSAKPGADARRERALQHIDLIH
eukprot:g6361.t1